MALIQKKREPPFEDELEIRQFYGRNTFGDHAALRPGELLECINYEVYKDQLKSRRGTQFNSDGSNIVPSLDVINTATWDTGVSEYLFIQLGSKIYYHNTTTPDGYTELFLTGGGAFSLTTSVRADLFVTGDKLFVFHEEGNFIIEFDDTLSPKFTARTMGLPAARIIQAIQGSTGGNITGKYTYGVEIAYYKNDGEITASSPWRVKVGTKKLATVIVDEDGIDPSKVTITIDSTVLDSDTTWTHLKLWRSLNQGINTDGLNADGSLIVDDQGDQDILFLLAVISKAEMQGAFGAVTPPSEADPIIPRGNTNIEAGLVPGVPSVYTIFDNNTDDGLTTYDYTTRSSKLKTLELEPIPAASLGAVHNKRIWVSAVNNSIIFENSGNVMNDFSNNNVYYSPFDTSIYYELTSPSTFLDISRDGQETKKLISFEKDLIVIKESQTCRQPYGDLSYPFEVLDTRIGISDERFAQFVPELGICAITNNYKEFMIFGYDQIWRSTLNGIEISHSNRASTESYDPSKVSMAYSNAKLFIAKGGGNFDILNAGEKRGWSEFQYSMNGNDAHVFNFNNGNKIGAVTSSQFMMELEVEALDTDSSWVNETTGNLINLEHITHRFQYNDGGWILTHHWLGIMASITRNLNGIPFVNGVEWPTPSSETITRFTPSADFVPIEALKNKEFRLYIEPATIGNFDWCFMVGNYLHYKINTLAPATMKVHKVRAIFDEPGFYFDPFQNVNEPDTVPLWFGSSEEIEETGTATDTITETGTATDTITEE